MTRILETIAGIQAYVTACRKQGRRVGFVPTMGAFHEGHLTLMREARRNNGAVIVSIFVNPIQFTAGEDYDRYPRRIEQDTKMAASEGVDVIFAPSVAEMYPKGFDTFVDQSDLPGKLCGEFRVGHFRGVMTIVTKLFNIVKPDAAYFGQKDFQQSLIIRRTVTDLNLEVAIKILPTVREEDGVAMSSRNLYLGPKQRKDATCLIQALRLAEDLVNGGESSAAQVSSEMRRLIRKVKGTRVEYIAIVNSDTLEPVKEIKGKTLIALAVRIGKARLIDNVIV
ncbi:MAG TPA: pantoate--beta-alanine ligase [Planctomycetota bacterium]|nr:pantoate--beta-alanine ligase [Planctomycetota bacterium]